MKIFSVSLFIITISINGFAQNIPGFIEKDLFSQGPEKLKKYGSNYNHSEGWEIYIENDSIRTCKIGYNSMGKHMNEMNEIPARIKNSPLSLYNKPMGDIVSLKVSNGWIIGRDAGEWGGDLKWYSKRGYRKKEIYGMVHQLNRFNNEIYAISGIYHMSLSSGRLLNIEYDETKKEWTTNILYNFNEYPFVYTKVGSYFYVITEKNFIRIDENNNVTYLYKDGFWSLMYPNSIIFFENCFYIGMRGGILKINISGDEIEKQWFVNNK